MDTVRKLSMQAEQTLNSGLGNPYIMGTLKVLLVLYASRIAPDLPEYLSSWFSNTFVKIGLIFLMIYIAERDFQLAILIAIIFVLGTNVLSGRGVLESFANYNQEYTKHGNQTLIEPRSVIMPCVEGITPEELLESFEGDESQMHETIIYAFKKLYAMSKGKTAKERLMHIAKAVGLPYNYDPFAEHLDEATRNRNAGYLATMLINYGFTVKKGDKVCGQPGHDQPTCK